MWGGFAMIQLDPANTKPALIMGSQDRLFKRVYLSSLHFIKDRFQFLLPLKSWLFKKLELKWLKRLKRLKRLKTQSLNFVSPIVGKCIVIFKIC